MRPPSRPFTEAEQAIYDAAWADLLHDEKRWRDATMQRAIEAELQALTLSAANERLRAEMNRLVAGARRARLEYWLGIVGSALTAVLVGLVLLAGAAEIAKRLMT